MVRQRKTPIVLAALCLTFAAATDLYAGCGDYVMIGDGSHVAKKKTTDDETPKPKRQCLGAYCKPLPDSSSQAFPVSPKTHEQQVACAQRAFRSPIIMEGLCPIDNIGCPVRRLCRIFHPPRFEC